MRTTESVNAKLTPTRPDWQAAAVAAGAGVVPCLASWLYVYGMPGTTLARAVYTATKAFTVLWPILAVVVIEKRGFRSAPQPRLPLGKVLRTGLLTGLAIGGGIAGLYLLPPITERAQAAAPAVRQFAQAMALTTPARYIAFALFLSAVHSLIEEFFWRWYVFGRLARVLPGTLAGLLGSLAFAAHHYVVLSTMFPLAETLIFGSGVAVGGLIWCGLLRRQHTLIGAWISHAIVDVVILSIGYHLVFA